MMGYLLAAMVGAAVGVVAMALVCAGNDREWREYADRVLDALNECVLALPPMQADIICGLLEAVDARPDAEGAE